MLPSLHELPAPTGWRNAPRAAWRSRARFTVLLERGVLGTMHLRSGIRKELASMVPSPSALDKILALDIVGIGHAPTRREIVTIVSDLLQGAIDTEIGPYVYQRSVGIDFPNDCRPSLSKATAVWYTVTREQRNQAKIDTMDMPRVSSTSGAAARDDTQTNERLEPQPEERRKRRTLERAGEFVYSPLELVRLALTPYYDRGFFYIDSSSGRDWYSVTFPHVVFAENDVDTASLHFVRENAEPNIHPLDQK